MPLPEHCASRFPEAIPDPNDYLAGEEVPDRPRVVAPLVFLRRTGRALRQRDLANRIHHRHVLMLVLETGGRVNLDGTSLRLEPGEGLLVLPYQFHHYTQLDAGHLRWLFVTFETDAASARLRRLGNTVLRPGETALRVWADLAALWRAGGSDRMECAPRLEQLLVRLSENSTAAPADAGKATGGGDATWLARVEALLMEAVETGRGIAEVAASVGLSERQLRNRFRARAGVGIRRYRANYQLHRAAALLREEAAPIGAAAQACGFGSAAAFCRFIRRETGMTPRAWRAFVSGRHPNPPDAP